MKKISLRGSLTYAYVVMIIILLVSFTGTGCGPSQQEIMDRERAELQAKAQARAAEEARRQAEEAKRKDEETAFANAAKRYREMPVKPALPEDVQRCRIMAEDAFKNKDFEKALEYYKKGLAIEPLWPQGQFNAAILAGELQRYNGAALYMKRYLELVHDAGDARRAREKMYLWEMKAKERGKEIKRDGRFVAYDKGTVLDTKTNLMWAAEDNGSNINWQGAKSYCENYRGGGYTDWRMPTQDELAGLYDAGKSRLAPCDSDTKTPLHVATELINITCYAPWASETRGSDAAFFTFNDGDRGWFLHSNAHHGGTRAVPVRSVK
jgi:tetratricopeptide (TPR) repeat protein